MLRSHSQWQLRSCVLVFVGLLVAPVAHATSPEEGLVLRVSKKEASRIAQDYGFSLEETAQLRRGDHRLLRLRESQLTAQGQNALLSDGGVLAAEPAAVASLPIVESGEGLATRALGSQELSRGQLRLGCRQNFDQLGWSGYVGQDAFARIGLSESARMAGRCGHGVTVAVIDTGVSSTLASLEKMTLEGYDFLLEEKGASEWNALSAEDAVDVEQSITAIVEQSITAIVEGEGVPVVLDQSITAIVEQSITAIVEDLDLPKAFGHGTLVAGLIHAIAPEAQILPLRAFGSDGTADLFDVIRAIYYAVDHGADVINMSFSTSVDSAELRHAIKYAKEHGVVCVAATGNRGSDRLVYPAAEEWVAGVASVDAQSERSTFSNYGEGLTSFGAPGEALISVFPGGLYAAVWGTSFSAPLVSGALAVLLASSSEEVEGDNAAGALRDTALEAGEDSALGEGILDVSRALRKLRSDD